MILTESPSLDIFLKSDHFVAGDHITGEILLSSPKPRQTLILTSTGRETLQITPAKGSTKSLRTEIYSFSQTIEDSTQQNQSLFPFSLKIPAFCPATFNFDHIDTNQTQINAEVVYEISAVLMKKSKQILTISKKFVVFNQKSRQPYKEINETIRPLSCCICIPRGSVSIAIKNHNSTDSICNDSLKYKVLLQSDNNKHLESIVAQVVFEFSAKVQDFELNFQKIAFKAVPNVITIKEKSTNLAELIHFVDIDLSSEQFVRNVCSNECANMNSKYTLQVFAVYDVGWRSKLIDVDLLIHVNPAKNVNEFDTPDNWNPVVYKNSKFEATSINAHLYRSVLN